MMTRSRQVYFPLGVIIVATAALTVEMLSATAEQYAHERLWSDLLARPSGPGAFRFYLQPTMGAIAALRDGIADARTGRTAYLWSLLAEPAGRRARLREGLLQTRRIMVLGIVIEALYQLIVLRAFYPLELILIVLLLCFVPYLLLRGPFSRVARWWFLRRTAG